MQSFAPLFLILFIKYFDLRIFKLVSLFFINCFCVPEETVIKAVIHRLFITCLLEVFCLLWVIYSIYGIKKFTISQEAEFVSEGESLIDIEKLPDAGVTFFMTYVLPMAMDDLNTLRGITVFIILIVMLFALMWKTNLYYQNPVLTILGYEVFSFKFETTQSDEYKNKECIGITRGNVEIGNTIKRQKISDNVFLVYENWR